MRFPQKDRGADDELERLPLGGQPLHRLERAAIRQTLARTLGNKAQAAELLGIAVSTLYEKLRRYEIHDRSASERPVAFV
jgi:DNA-binding NtrC family response regulator